MRFIFSNPVLLEGSSCDQEDDGTLDTAPTPSQAIYCLQRIFFRRNAKNRVCGQSPTLGLHRNFGTLLERPGCGDRTEPDSRLCLFFRGFLRGRRLPVLDASNKTLAHSSHYWLVGNLLNIAICYSVLALRGRLHRIHDNSGCHQKLLDWLSDAGIYISPNKISGGHATQTFLRRIEYRGDVTCAYSTTYLP